MDYSAQETLDYQTVCLATCYQTELVPVHYTQGALFLRHMKLFMLA